jgi:hypothetical protein
MNKVLAVLALLVAGAVSLPAQAFVQISSVRARPETLTCTGPGATARVRVQVYLAGIPDAVKGATAALQLAIYSAIPSVNKVEIREGTKEFALADSPALVDFEVNCTSDTLPGDITLAATIATAPEGLPIREPAVEPLVHLKVVRPR